MALHTDPQRIFEAAARQYAVRATCPQCKHSAIFDPHALWWLFERHGWDQRLWKCGARFRCVICKRRGCTIDLVQALPTIDDLPLPDARTWKRAVNRYRG